MAASVSGSKTCLVDLGPHITGSNLTTLLAIAPENLTVKQFHQIRDAIARCPGGDEPGTTLATLFQ